MHVINEKTLSNRVSRYRPQVPGRFGLPVASRYLEGSPVPGTSEIPVPPKNSSYRPSLPSLPNGPWDVFLF